MTSPSAPLSRGSASDDPRPILFPSAPQLMAKVGHAVDHLFLLTMVGMSPVSRPHLSLQYSLMTLSQLCVPTGYIR